MSRRRAVTDNFWDSATTNNLTYIQYFNRLTEISISMFEWQGLPDTVDPRYLELCLFNEGKAVYFADDVIGELCLNCIPQDRMNVYGEPVLRRAYSSYNNYNKLLTENNSVVIWNNYIRTNSLLDVKMYAKRLYNLDRIIDVNANAQKTPVLVQGTDKQRLTLLNLYKEFEGNAPVIFGDKNLDLNALKVLSTNAPYVCDKLYELKTQIWNEALTSQGVSNVSFQKKERMGTEESARTQGATMATRMSKLKSRKAAAVKISEMFDREITVEYNDEVESLAGSLESGVSQAGLGGDQNG